MFFSWQTADGLAGTASDYIAQVATEVGGTSAILEVPTTDDSLSEVVETFTVMISASNLPDEVSLGIDTTATATATATITDGGAPPRSQIDLFQGANLVDESGARCGRNRASLFHRAGPAGDIGYSCV